MAIALVSSLVRGVGEPWVYKFPLDVKGVPSFNPNAYRLRYMAYLSCVGCMANLNIAKVVGPFKILAQPNKKS